MDPVVSQLEAYNARDIERFIACYDPEVRIEDGEGAPCEDDVFEDDAR